MKPHLSAITLIVAAVATAAPARLKTYADLKGVLLRGQAVRAVFDYGKLKLQVEGREEPAPKAIGGMPLLNWESFAKGVVRNKLEYLASSQTALIAHPSYGTVLNYVRVRISEDGSVQIVARYYDPKTFEVRMDETFVGSISNGADSNGVHLFADR